MSTTCSSRGRLREIHGGGVSIVWEAGGRRVACGWVETFMVGFV